MDEGINMSSCEGEQEFWDELLAFIGQRHVIPVVGPELLNIVESGRTIPLYQAVAERLLKNYSFSAATGEKADSFPADDLSSAKTAYLRPRNELNDAVCFLAQKGKRVQDLYRPINTVIEELIISILAEQKEEVLVPLRQLASISHFDLFVTTTFDDLLVKAIDLERFDGRAETAQIEFAPMLPVNKRTDLPESQSRPEGYTAVFYLFGKASPLSTYAIHDEDILEFVYNYFVNDPKVENLQTRDVNVPRRFLSEIRGRDLLLIGCNFADWLSRFFLRISTPGRLMADRDKREFMVGKASLAERSLTVFLERFSQNTRIYPCSARDFVLRLSKRWQDHVKARPPGKKAAPILVKPSGAALSKGIFISYAHEDLEAAKKLFDGLKKIGGDVIWFDKSTLQPGDKWEAEIKEAITHCRLFLPLISENTEMRPRGVFRQEWFWASKCSEGIAERYIIPIIIDSNYEGKPDKYKKMPDRFKEFHLSHAPTGEMSKELSDLLLLEIGSIKEERKP